MALIYITIRNPIPKPCENDWDPIDLPQNFTDYKSLSSQLNTQLNAVKHQFEQSVSRLNH